MSEELTQKKMIAQVHQAVVGIPENPEENGIIGDVAEIKEHLKTQNGRIVKAERSISRIIGIGAGIGGVVAVAGTIIGVIQATG